MTKNKVNLHIYYMSTVYTNIKNKKLTVETSNTNYKSPYGTDNKESGGEVVAKFESTKLLCSCIQQRI